MDLWCHYENPYPFVPSEVLADAESVRASLPNRYCHPGIAARLFDEMFDEQQACDDLGINIVTTEHHSGINNLCGANPLVTAVAARLTKKVRILSLGTLVTVRPDPVRIAEEYATLDVLSKGRLEIGFVKSGGSEMASGDANPMRLREREWEAVDLIDKALTSHDGPFSWEGKFFTHPHVNIWPRPLQQPRPDFWMATSDPPNVVQLGRRGMVMVSVFTGAKRARVATELYRQSWAETHAVPVPESRLGYCAFCIVADTDAEALRIVEKAGWFHSVAGKVAPQFNKFLPGFYSEDRLVQAWREKPRAMEFSPEGLIAAGLIFAGNPDTVARQVKSFRATVGGLGHLVVNSKTGLVTHAEAMRSYRLMADDVLPQLQGLEPVERAA